MDILNLPNCATAESQFNTGILICDILKGRLRGLIYADRGTVLTPADLATVATTIAAIKAKTIAPRGGRMYPIWDLQNFEDNTGDPTTGAVGNLSTATIVTNDAVPAFSFGYSGGEIRHQRMASMVSGSYDVFFVDDKYSVYGVRDGVNLKGYTILQSYVYASKFIVADAVNQYRFRITLSDISEYRDRSGFVVTNSGILSAAGLINFSLKEVSHVTNVWKIAATADGGTNLAALYPALSSGTYTAKKADGTNLAITNVATDNTTDVTLLQFTFDSTAYNTLAANAPITIYPPSSASLSALGVKPYEGIPLTILKS